VREFDRRAVVVGLPMVVPTGANFEEIAVDNLAKGAG
jgi:hypothetical protein